MEETHCQVLQSMDVATIAWLWSHGVGSGLSASIYSFFRRICQAHSAGKHTDKDLLFSWNQHLVEMGRIVHSFELVPLKKLVLSLVVFLVHSVQTTVWTCQQAALTL